MRKKEKEKEVGQNVWQHDNGNLLQNDEPFQAAQRNGLEHTQTPRCSTYHGAENCVGAERLVAADALEVRPSYRARLSNTRIEHQTLISKMKDKRRGEIL